MMFRVAIVPVDKIQQIVQKCIVFMEALLLLLKQ